MRTDGWAAAAAAVVLAFAAGLVPAARAPSLPADVIATRAALVGAERSGATLLWLRAVDRFAEAAGSPNDQQTALIDDDLNMATRLDPGFDEPWLEGALMLAVVEGGAGPRGRALRSRGQTARPDLPWSLVETP